LFKSRLADFADGGQRRDFIYVDDVVEVILWCLDHGPKQGLFNVGTGHATSFNELIGALFTAVDRPSRISYFDMPETLRDKYQYFTEAPIGALRAAGYAAPFTPIPDAVARYVRYLSNMDRYR
jgi:ADP-L-glycero-D-manno-heptose 6-epimerase